MTWLKGLNSHSWWLADASIVGLMVAIALAGLAALGINDRVRDVLVEAIQYDLEIEDRADDLRVSILDLRHYHRNLVFGGPSPRRLDDFEAGYKQLLVHIEELDQLGISEPNLPMPDVIQTAAERYYASFRPVIELYETNHQAFEVASEDGLWLLAELESEVRRIERFGERQAAEAIQGVEDAANSASVLLLAKLFGHILTGAGLAFLIVRNLREQRKAAKELALALKMKTDFIADMSHELRTPLTVLRANAEVALDLERNCVHTELLQEIVEESERMTHLVDDLLFLARSDSGALPFEWEVVSIRPFLAELAQRATTLARQYDVEVHLDLTAKGYVRIDRTRLGQAVLNLIDNAAKYSSSSTEIRLRSSVHNGEAIIEVRDYGIGIDKGNLSQIFERFYRVDKTRSRNGGSAGLGLAIAKSIVQAHGGKIEATSELNQGTSMYIRLPLVAALQTAHTANEQWIAEEVSSV